MRLEPFYSGGAWVPKTGKTRALNLFTRMNPENWILKKQQQLKMIAYKQLKVWKEEKADTLWKANMNDAFSVPPKENMQYS